MNWKNDIILAEKVPEIDLILGGHNHWAKTELINDRCLIVKSGCDFRYFSYITVEQITKIGELNLKSFKVQ